MRPRHTPQVPGFLRFPFRFKYPRLPIMPPLVTRTRSLLLLLSACLAATAVHAADAAEPQEVSYPSGSETVHALLYAPAGSSAGKHPAVIVIHE